MRISGVIVATVGLLLAGGGARLAYIETRQGDALRALAQRQQVTHVVIPSLRGEILDTRGRVLAGTLRRPSLFADTKFVHDPAFAAHSLAPVLGMRAADLETTLSDPAQPRFVWLKRQISDEEAEAFETVVRTRGLHGLEVQHESVRVYPQGRLASHVLGFAGLDRIPATAELPAHEDLVGRLGVEAQYDELLRGRPGLRAATVDVVRRRVRAEDYIPAEDGCTLVLTIDAFLQQMVEDKLRKAVLEMHKAEWGAAVVIDPQTGEVLAMASAPDFDPANPAPPGYERLTPEQQIEAQVIWRNRAISDAYEPGSVFKPFVASCALDEGLVNIDQVFPINGPVHIFGRRSIRDTHPYGSLAVHEIVSKSSNIGMGMIGAKAGLERLHRWVRSFGFGDETGIGLPIEHTGIVQSFDKWNPSFSPQSIPIGQEISVTPIQIVSAFSVFCNGGVLLRPRIVRGVIGPDGETVEDCSRPVPIRRVLSTATAEMFRQRALVETVRTGTGKLAQLEDWQVFGKTGTAQVAAPGGRGYQSGKYVASFVAGAPARHPQVVVLVSIIKPTARGYYGGVVSAPIVKEIIAEALTYMQVPPEPVEPLPGTRKAAAGAQRKSTHDSAGD